MPEISVIIPVYNRPVLLAEAVESVFAQTFTDYELIIVDDGSDDETPGVASALCVSEAASGRVSLLRLSHAGFPGAARNRGAEAASGKYLAFLDSDDTWLPEKLEAQYRFMKEAYMGGSRGAEISHTREVWRRGDKIVSQKGQKHSREGDIFSDALTKCIIGPSTVMMERSFYLKTGGFNEKLEIAEDYEFWLRITSGWIVGYVNEALTTKRAGGWPQLSEKYGMIEWFRIAALAGLLGVKIPGTEFEPVWLPGWVWNGFPDQKRAEAFETLVYKLGIWSAGCRKRGKHEEADRMDAVIAEIA